jgi:hypothetical protein
LGFKQNKKALAALLIALIVIGVVIVVIGVAVAVVLIYAEPGNRKTMDYTNTGFSSVDVGSAFQVNIVRSDNFSVKITAGERLFDRIQVTQTGSTLKIEVKPGIFVIGTFDAKAEISMPALDNLTLSGATRATAVGFNATTPFITKLSGASSLDMTNAGFGDVNVELSGASHLTMQGTGGNLTAVVSGTSNLNLNNFPVSNANLNVSGASHAEVDTGGLLNVDASGASSVQYSGNPTLGTIHSSGLSSVNKK